MVRFLICLVLLPSFGFASEEVLDTILAELGRLGHKTEELEAKLVEKDKRIELLEEKIAARDREISKLQTYFRTPSEIDRRNLGFISESEVGFSARVSSHVKLVANQPIVFGTILTNIGNHFNNTTGVFYVPVAGTYMFYVSILSEPNNFIETELLVNGNLLAEIYSGSGKFHGSGSNFVVVHLAQGDNVWVKVHEAISSNMVVHCCWSTFSGYLLREGNSVGQGQIVG